MSDESINARLHCLNVLCDHSFDAAVSVFDPEHRPEDGDRSVCIRCGSIAIFEVEEGGQVTGLRAPTADEKADVMDNPEYHIMLEMIYQNKQRREASE